MPPIPRTETRTGVKLAIPEGEGAQPEFRARAFSGAQRTIGTLEPGSRLVCLTLGQFSFLEVIRAVLGSTGPAHLLVSTFSVGARDAEALASMIGRGELLSIKALIGQSFGGGARMEYAERFAALIGPDNLTEYKTHAKYAVLRNDDWAVTIRGSMNLNRNRQLEQFDVDANPAIADFFTSHTLDLMAGVSPGPCRSAEELRAAIMGATLGEDPTRLGLTVIEYAKHRGCSKSAVYNQIRTGVLVKLDNGRLDPDDCDRRWAQSKLGGTAGGNHAPGPAARETFGAASGTVIRAHTADLGEITLHTAKIREVAARAALAEINVAQKRGELVHLAEVRRGWFDVCRLARNRLEGLPDRLASVLALEADAHTVRVRLADEIRVALAGLADDLEAPAAEPAPAKPKSRKKSPRAAVKRKPAKAKVRVQRNHSSPGDPS